MSGRIDVHQHMIPPGYAAWLRDRGVHAAGGRALPEWSPDLALEFMDRQGIATGILSISTPGVHLGDDTEARTVAREVNNYGAALAALHPGRFGIWASLPLPDIAGAVAEATRVLDQSTADGIVLLPTTAAFTLGIPRSTRSWPSWTTATQCCSSTPPTCPVRPCPASRHSPPTSSSIPRAPPSTLSGMTSPAATRTSDSSSPTPEDSFRTPPTAWLSPCSPKPDMTRPSSWTTCQASTSTPPLSSSPSTLPSLRAFARPGHILYGSDWPFAPDLAVEYFLGPIAENDDIARATSRPLLPRVN